MSPNARFFLDLFFAPPVLPVLDTPALLLGAFAKYRTEQGREKLVAVELSLILCVRKEREEERKEGVELVRALELFEENVEKEEKESEEEEEKVSVRPRVELKFNLFA